MNACAVVRLASGRTPVPRRLFLAPEKSCGRQGQRRAPEHEEAGDFQEIARQAQTRALRARSAAAALTNQARLFDGFISTSSARRPPPCRQPATARASAAAPQDRD